MVNVIELLQKLIEHERSARAIGSIAEAETFAAKAQELLTKHKLEMTDVEFAAEEAAAPPEEERFYVNTKLGMSSNRNDGWIGVLIEAISRANFCRVIRRHVTSGTNVFSIVGRKPDRDTTKALFIYLSEAAIQTSVREAYLGDAPVASAGEFMRGFKFGFAAAIADRLAIKKKELTAGAGTQGLIRLNQIELAVKEKYDELFPDTVTSTVSTRNHDGYVAGHAYGQAIGINATKRLTA